jgi:hypothetical protein
MSTIIDEIKARAKKTEERAKLHSKLAISHQIAFPHNEPTNVVLGRAVKRSTLDILRKYLNDTSATALNAYIDHLPPYDQFLILNDIEDVAIQAINIPAHQWVPMLQDRVAYYANQINNANNGGYQPYANQLLIENADNNQEAQDDNGQDEQVQAIGQGLTNKLTLAKLQKMAGNDNKRYKKLK